MVAHRKARHTDPDLAVFIATRNDDVGGASNIHADSDCKNASSGKRGLKREAFGLGLSKSVEL